MTDPTESYLALLVSSTSIAGAITAVAKLFDRLMTSIEQARESRKRRAKLDAYRLRRSWKASDKKKVEQLDPSETVRRRLKRLTGRGRPVVKNYIPFDEGIMNALCAINNFYEPNTAHNSRLMILKKTPWLPHFIEAVYSTELAVERKRGNTHAAEDARKVTADAFLTNTVTVRHEVTAARAERRKHGWKKGPVMRVEDFEHWKQTGKLPD